MTETNSEIHWIGNARGSTYGQTLDAQLEQLKADECFKINREKTKQGSKSYR